MTAKLYRVSFVGDEDILESDGGDGCTTRNALKTTDLYIVNG